MPKKLYDENGTEIEAFDQEEVNALKKEHEDLVAAKEAELQAAKAELEKEGDKGENFKALREKAKQAEEAKNQVAADFDKKLEALKNDLTADKIESNKKYQAELIEQLSQGDKEIAKKMELELKGFNATPKTQEEIKTLVVKSYKLSVDTPKPGFLDGIVGTHGRSPDVGEKKATDFSPNAMAMAKVFGIEAEVEKLNKDK